MRDEDARRIVGTYRILSPSAARHVGGYYSENEFDRRSCIDAVAPALIKGYLRAGPAWDPDFNTADLPIPLLMNRIDGRYARHFLGRTD